MSWLSSLKNRFFSGRQELKESLMDESNDPTRGYRASRFYAVETVINELPIFTLNTARLMLASDPIVNFSLNIRNAALSTGEVEIKAKRPDVQAWLETQWKTLWHQNLLKLTSAKKWGFAPLQVMFKSNQDGLVHIEGLKDFAPQDCRAHSYAGRVVGFEVRGSMKVKKITNPRALWLTFGGEFGQAYGCPTTKRSYPPWYEKWMDRGAKKLGQQRMMKDAYRGDIFWFPENQMVKIAGTQYSWRDVLREVAENAMSGSALTLPFTRDKDGNKNIEYDPPQDITGKTEIFVWEDRLDEQILRGADISIEVVKAQENGGFSGRSIPFMVLLSVCTQELGDIVQQVDYQTLRPTAWANWGGDPEYTITAKSLVESFATDASGSPMGGGAIGGQPGQRPPTQAPPPQQSQQSPRMGWVSGDGKVTQFHEDDPDGKWVTIGGRKSGEEDHKGGFPVQIDANGNILKSGGPQTLVGNAQFDESAPLDIAFLGAASATRRLEATRQRIRSLLKQADLAKPGSLMAEIERSLLELQPGISADLSASMLGGQFTGMADAITDIPFPLAVPPVVPLSDLPPAEPPKPPTLEGFFDDEPDPPKAIFPSVQDAIDTLHASPVFVGSDFRETAAAVKEGAFAITGDLAADATAEIRSLLAKHLEEGPDREEFASQVNSLLGTGRLSDEHIQLVFRQNVGQAVSDGRDRALKQPLVVDAFPYRGYSATTDARVRKTHRALEHLGLDSTNIYRADDPTWHMFRPKWDWNCRCDWYPVSVEQAARAGVTEAKDWWNRAKAMADEQGGSPYQYLTRTAPAEPQYVQPPPFRPDPEFTRGVA